ncbi:hypothetical protein [Paenibacillus tepidiphilus]
MLTPEIQKQLDIYYKDKLNEKLCLTHCLIH